MATSSPRRYVKYPYYSLWQILHCLFSCVDLSLKVFFWYYCWHCNEMSTSTIAIVPKTLIPRLIGGICVLFLQNYLMTTDSFLFINLIYILPYRIMHYYILICTNNKYFKTCPLSVYLTIMFCIILLILIIFSIVFYWYVSSKEYWYA